MFVVSSKCRQITRTFSPIGFMVVSAVDLLYVFGRSFVRSDELTLLVQLGGNHCGVLALFVVPRRGLQQCYNNISVFILV